MEEPWLPPGLFPICLERGSVDPEYRYYAISLRGNEVGVGPTPVCRRWADENGVTHDEVYVIGSGWAPTTELAEAESGARDTQAHAITPDTAAAFIDADEGRLVSYDPVDGKYGYYAWLDDGKSSLDDMLRLIRAWTSPQGYNMENTYTTDAGWVRSYLREDVSDFRRRGWLKEITEEEAERLKATAYTQRDQV